MSVCAGVVESEKIYHYIILKQHMFQMSFAGIFTAIIEKQ